MSSADEHTTVHVKNISSQTTEEQVKDFFSFCGKIAHLTLHKDGETQSASVTFEKATAAKTAMLLDNTQLGPSLVQVSASPSLDQLSSPTGAGHSGTAADSNDVPQEDKPRSRIAAEYLAHGYGLSDQVIERAIALDKQHGVSNKFTSALAQWDQKLQASQKAQTMDKQYGISDKAGQGYRSFHSYFEKALGSPTGQKVRDFYVNTSKQVYDVHQEARRLADMKKPQQPESASAGSSGPTAPAAASHEEQVEKMHMSKIPGTDNTQCTCGGSEGTCPCEPGKCRCANCNKNPEKSASSATGEAAKAAEASKDSSTAATQ